MRKKTRIIIIQNKDFAKFWKVVNEGYLIQDYEDNFLSIQNASYIDFKNKYNMDPFLAKKMLDNIFECANLSLKEICEKAGKKKTQVRDIFCIPQRTVEDWYYEKKKMNPAIKLMVLKQFHLLDLGKYIYLESDIEFENTKPAIYEKHSDKRQERKRKLDEIQKEIVPEEPDNVEVEDDDLEFERMLDSIYDHSKASKAISSYNKESIDSIIRKTDYLDEIMKKNKK